MQKKIIALAVAGLVSGAAFAQSNVTIYGIADAAYVYSKSGTADGAKHDATFSGIESGGWNGSRLGFKGEEALGNGLKAIFRMEFGTEVDGNAKSTETGGLSRTRWAYVGLDSSYGEVTLGKLKSAAEMYYGDNSANTKTGNGALDVLGGAYQKAVGGVLSGRHSYIDNAVAFQSKDYNGFSGRVMYGFGENAGSKDPAVDADGATDGIAGISGKYNNGSLNIDAMYYTKMNQTSTVADYNDKDINEWMLGGSYDFKVVKAFATYQQSKNKGTSTDTGAIGTSSAVPVLLNAPKLDLWSVGVSAPVNANGTVMLEYAKATLKADNYDQKAKSWGTTLSYVHQLSKRTKLYTSLGYINNNDSAQASYKSVGQLGENNWNLLTGVGHSF